MIVVSLEVCPPSLRGDITKWLLEIDTNVYAGNMSARVRDELWNKISKAARTTGRAIMAFDSKNEQGMDFYVHNCQWEPTDFDGLKLMLRPSANRMDGHAAGDSATALKPGFSKASKYRTAKFFARKRRGG
jgi:CRISPR-associated protein Cas2